METRLALTALLALARAAAIVASSASIALASAAEPFNPSPHAIDIPAWFKTSFLDFREDISEAAQDGRRLMVYFGQDGCPYCRELMRVNFSQKEIADKTRRHFEAVALNIWGDREVTWLDGNTYSEKALAVRLKVQFTPTLLFLDEQGHIVLRLNGYYPPHQFSAVLDYVAGRRDRHEPLAAYIAKHARAPASGRLHAQPFFMRAPYDLARAMKRGKPLAVLFEQTDCAACDELHAKAFTDTQVQALLPAFTVVRLELFGGDAVVTPTGAHSMEAAFGRDLRVTYTPTIVFFDVAGKEVFRLEAYLRPFHIASGFDYVASSAYRREPSFQRYIQARAERIRKSGGRVNLW